MGICWSEPPVSPVQTRSPVYPEKVVATAPPYQPPMNQYSQYTYTVKPEQQIGYQYQYPQQQYPQQQYAAYPYQQYQQQYVQPYPPQQRPTAGGNAATAFVGGLVLGAVIEDILDPTE